MEIPVTHVTIERKIYHAQSVTCTLWELTYLHSVTKPSRDGNLGGHWRAESSSMIFENRIYHDIISVSTFSSKRNQNMTKLAKTKTKLGRPAKMQGLGVVFFAQIPSNVRLRPFSVTLAPDGPAGSTSACSHLTVRTLLAASMPSLCPHRSS